MMPSFRWISRLLLVLMVGLPSVAAVGQTVSEETLRRDLAQAEKQYGVESEPVRKALKRLVLRLRDDEKRQHDYLTLLDRLVPLTRVKFGDAHPETLGVIVMQGRALAAAGKFDRAEPLLIEAFTSIQRHADLQAGMATTLSIIDALAGIHAQTNRLTSAIQLLENALKLRNSEYRPDDKRLYGNLNALAEYHWAAGNREKAFDYYRRTLALIKAQTSANPLILAIYQNRVADRYGKADRYDDALALYKLSLATFEQHLEPDHSRIAGTVFGIASLLEAKGDYAAALPFAKRNLALREKRHGKTHPLVAGSLVGLAKIQVSLGNFEAAVPLYQRSLAILATTIGKDDIKYALTSIKLAHLLKKMARYDDALPLYEQSLPVLEGKLGKNHRTVGAVLNNFALLKSDMGRFREALSLYQRSLVIKEQSGEEDLDLAITLNNMAALQDELGNRQESMGLYVRSLAILERILGPEHPDVLIATNNLAGVYLHAGDYSKAAFLRQRVLRATEHKLGAEHPNFATALNNLATVYDRMGRYPEALGLYRRSLSILETKYGPEHPKVANTLSNLVYVHGLLGDYTEALALMKRVIAIQEKTLGKDHPDLASSLNLLAGLQYELGRLDDAMALYRRALSIRKQTYGPDHLLVGVTLNDMANVFAHQGQRAEALKLFKRSLAIAEGVYGRDHPHLATDVSNLGHFYLDEDELDQAGRYLHRAVLLASVDPGGKETLWHIQYALSRLYARKTLPELAIVWGKQAVNTLQALRAKNEGLDESLQSSYLTIRRHVYQHLADLLIAQGRLGEAQTVLQMLKEQELHESLERSATSDPRSTEIPLTGLEQKRFARYYELRDQQVALTEERLELLQKQKTGVLDETGKARLAKIESKLLPPLRGAMLVFLEKLQSEAERFAQAEKRRSNAMPVDVAQTNLQKALDQIDASRPDGGVVALQYVVTDDRLSILLSTAGGPPVARQIAVDGKALRRDVVVLRALLSNPRSDRDVLQAKLKAMYGWLIAPVQSDLERLGAKTLMLVPNDVLRYVPFAALYDGKHYLVEGYTLTLFNEAVKKPFGSGGSADWRLAAMGLTRAVEDLPPLPNVADELEAITVGSGLGGKTYLDDQFTRAILTRTLNQDYTVLHLASHFILVAGRPEASRLFLGDRTPLTLGEIARENLRFDHFDLVTFSACESGLGGGRSADGRDMESLGALVQNQGAHAVMATLWKVNDMSTATLMEYFYRARQSDKLDKSGALRTAQLRFIKRKAGGRVWAHPYYWAPFVMMGDWR